MHKKTPYTTFCPLGEWNDDIEETTMTPSRRVTELKISNYGG
jgi:hypothetical protein